MYHQDDSSVPETSNLGQNIHEHDQEWAYGAVRVDQNPCPSFVLDSSNKPTNKHLSDMSIVTFRFTPYIPSLIIVFMLAFAQLRPTPWLAPAWPPRRPPSMSFPSTPILLSLRPSVRLRTISDDALHACTLLTHADASFLSDNVGRTTQHCLNLSVPSRRSIVSLIVGIVPIPVRRC
jgi:hypothetical protein